MALTVKAREVESPETLRAVGVIRPWTSRLGRESEGQGDLGRRWPVGCRTPETSRPVQNWCFVLRWRWHCLLLNKAAHTYLQARTAGFSVALD